MSNDNLKRCDFCGAEHTKAEWKELGVKLLRSKFTNEHGEKVRICSECASKAAKAISDQEKKSLKKSLDGIIPEINTPRDIKEYLDQWVIEQERPKIAVSTELYAHNKRIKRLRDDVKASRELRMDKSNMIYLGPTGSGKTELTRAMCSCLDLPYTVEDTSSLSATGYVGRDTSDILKNLYMAAGRDIEKAQTGIVFLDEFDKIRASDDGRDNKDVNGKAVQQGILKMIEGAIIDVPLDKMGSQVVKFDTTNVLFIIGGAFVGLEKIIDKRLKQGTKTIGFGGTPEAKKEIDYNNTISQVIPDDLVKFGIIPEVVGRCPIIATFNELSEDAMVKILTEPKHALIKQYKEEFKMDNVEFEITDSALRKVAKKANERKMGARALRTVMEDVLFDTKFNVPGDPTVAKVVVHDDLTVSVIKKEEKVGAEA